MRPLSMILSIAITLAIFIGGSYILGFDQTQAPVVFKKWNGMDVLPVVILVALVILWMAIYVAIELIVEALSS